jgi:acetylornithine deacetylase/succinyl-diaminopimelate desuccinylase-like protein
MEEALHPLLIEALEGCGFSVELQRTGVGRRNLLAKRGESPLLIATHLDTFPAYTHPEPYRLRVEGEELIARGALDVKGQIAALLAAVESCDHPVQVALVVDEERFGTGSRELALDPYVRGAVVLEPTDLHPAPAQAGAVDFTAIVYGKAAHGSLPQRGESAILKAFQLIQAIEALPFMRMRHPLFPDGPRVTVGTIQGGFEPMVVPNTCRLEADVRFLPGVELEAALQELTGCLQAFGTEFILGDADPPFEIPREEPIYRLLARAVEGVLGERRPPVGMPSWTDAANLVQKGIPTVVFGAGDLAVAHSDREAVSLSDLERLARVLIRLMAEATDL